MGVTAGMHDSHARGLAILITLKLSRVYLLRTVLSCMKLMAVP